MTKFSNEDIISYYEQTEVHYRRAWDLEASLAMHYGYWREDTRTFRESLQQMNEEMAKFGAITTTDRVLDAGCGVGGSAIFLAKTIGCKVTGITLSPGQVESAAANARENGVGHLANFVARDYTRTGFPDESFDVVWALESFIHAPDKQAFANEAFRLLKPCGRLVIGDYFRKETPLTRREEKTLNKWLHAIAATEMPKVSGFKNSLAQAGFCEIHFTNVTSHIRHSAWRQFYGSLFLRVLSALYRLYNPRVRPFADKHYRALHYQYISLRKKIWKYYLVRAVKAVGSKQ